MNKADSARLSGYLESWGFRPGSLREADIIIVNTCVVRQKAEDKAVSRLASLKPLKRSRPGVRIVLTGCLVDSREEELRRRFPHVDFFLKPQDFGSFLEWAERMGLGSPPSSEPLLRPGPSAFVPVIYGCDNFCTYCIVPFRRGRERSRPIAEITAEVRGLVKQGAREVVLLGQNINSYGHDLPERPDLGDLLEELNGIEGLLRIRFLTSYPKDISDKFIRTLARLEKVCPQLSLPVQSGDDGILQMMRRGYTAQEYRDLIARIREAIPEVAISTDVIVGFPGETEAAFENTLRLIRELRFDSVHIAAYSPRPGTWASRHLEDNIPPEVKRARHRQLERLQEEISRELNSRLVGREEEILVEGSEKGRWFGRTRSGKLVFFDHPGELTGRLVAVKIVRSTPWWLEGRVSKCLG